MTHEDTATDTGSGDVGISDTVPGATDGGAEQGDAANLNVNDGNPIQPEPQDETD